MLYFTYSYRDKDLAVRSSTTTYNHTLSDMDFNAKLISKMELLLPKLVEEGLATTAKVNKEKGGR